MKTSLALLLALAIISVDSKHLKLGCYVGSADNYLIKHGFDSCVAIHNISENSITLMGLHKNTALEEAFSSEGMTSDCVLRVILVTFITLSVDFSSWKPRSSSSSPANASPPCATSHGLENSFWSTDSTSTLTTREGCLLPLEFCTSDNW